MAKKPSSGSDLKGPPAVVRWLDVDFTRGGSPCVIRRKFKYILTHHERLAKQETELKALLDEPERKRRPATVRRLEQRVANRRAWLDFSVTTLENAIRFAVARISPNSADGRLLRQKYPNARMGRVNKKWWRTIHYYGAVVEEYKLAKAACAGHSGSNEALKKLMVHSARVVATWKRKSGREDSDAEQQALIGLLEAAERFDPAMSNLARFNTYASPRVRRRTQVRKASDCKPGTTLIRDKVAKKRKQVVRGNIEAEDDGNGRADRYHPAVTDEHRLLQLDIATALAGLSDADRTLAERRLIGGESVRALSEEFGVSPRKLKVRIEELRKKLATSLAAHDPCG